MHFNESENLVKNLFIILSGENGSSFICAIIKLFRIF